MPMNVMDRGTSHGMIHRLWASPADTAAAAIIGYVLQRQDS